MKMQTTILGLGFRNLGVSQNQGYLVGAPYNKDYSILGSTLGSLYVGKLPFLPSTVVSMLLSLKSHVKTAAIPMDLLPKSP